MIVWNIHIIVKRNARSSCCLLLTLQVGTFDTDVRWSERPLPTSYRVTRCVEREPGTVLLVFSLCFLLEKPSRTGDGRTSVGVDSGAKMLPNLRDYLQHYTIATRDHCIFAFEVLHAHLTGNPSPVPKFVDSQCALFVTWNTRSSGGHWKLRGCIGTLEPKQLHRALHDYALNSSVRDHRFSPIKLKELASLQCKVRAQARTVASLG